LPGWFSLLLLRNSAKHRQWNVATSPHKRIRSQFDVLATARLHFTHRIFDGLLARTRLPSGQGWFEFQCTKFRRDLLTHPWKVARDSWMRARSGRQAHAKRSVRLLPAVA
jgi:hypothetical protein